MNANQIEAYTASISHFDESRNYFGLSNFHLDVDALVKMYLEGQFADLATKLKCYKGYQMEKDLVFRIQQLYGSRISFRDISVHDGLIQGHPDFWYDDIPGDCKSVLMDAHLPEDKLPRKVYWQLQGYMLFGQATKAVAVYESRESGRIRHKWINRNESICQEIQEKVEAILRVANSVTL